MGPKPHSGLPSPHPGLPKPHPGIPKPHPGLPNPHSGLPRGECTDGRKFSPVFCRTLSPLGPLPCFPPCNFQKWKAGHGYRWPHDILGLLVISIVIFVFVIFCFFAHLSILGSHHFTRMSDWLGTIIESFQTFVETFMSPFVIFAITVIFLLFCWFQHFYTFSLF